MINQLLIAFTTVCVYEFIQFVKLLKIINSNLKIYKKIINIFKYKKSSDFRKEKLILNYSKSLFIISIKIFFILTCILFFIFLLNKFSSSFIESAISVYGIIEITIVFLIYHQLRKIINAKL